MWDLYKTYGFLGIFQLIYFRIRTKLLFKNARMIRFPFRIRGRKYVSVGKGFTTGFNCRIDAYSQNGNNCIKIGENVQINDSVHIGSIQEINIGDNVLIASKVFITDHNHGNYSGVNCDAPTSIPIDRELYSKPVVIEDNVWLGEFVSVLPGVTIGKGSIVGANSVVSKSLPPYVIAVGAPAKPIKKYNFENKLWERV